jgi:hypothetical protein
LDVYIAAGASGVAFLAAVAIPLPAAWRSAARGFSAPKRRTKTE